jgi:hypothetical protein
MVVRANAELFTIYSERRPFETKVGMPVVIELISDGTVDGSWRLVK